MVKSTESRKFARTTKHLSRIQGIAPNREIPTELLDDHRALEPPDPIPNSVVKRRIADGSVVLHHVRVGHRQAPIRNPRSRKRSGVSSLGRGIRNPRSPSGLGFLLCAAESWPEVVPAGAYGALCAPTNTGGYRGAHGMSVSGGARVECGEFRWGLSCLTRPPNLPYLPCRLNSWSPVMSAIY